MWIGWKTIIGCDLISRFKLPWLEIQAKCTTLSGPGLYDESPWLRPRQGSNRSPRSKQGGLALAHAKRALQEVLEVVFLPFWGSVAFQSRGRASSSSSRVLLATTQALQDVEKKARPILELLDARTALAVAALLPAQPGVDP